MMYFDSHRPIPVLTQAREQTITTKKPHQDFENFERGRPPAVETPPFNSLEEFMGGEITYAVAVPDTPDPTLTVQVNDNDNNTLGTLMNGRLEHCEPATVCHDRGGISMQCSLEARAGKSQE